MTTGLTMLLWSAVLAFIQMLVAAAGAQLQVGARVLAGNRENLPATTGWAGRAQRAHRNMVENLILFAILVLVAEAADRTNVVTDLGCQIFFWARVVYALVYVAGLPWIRTVVWLVSVIGLMLILSQLL